MNSLGEEIEEASRGQKVPHNPPENDANALRKSKAEDAAKRFDKVSSERNASEGEDFADLPGDDYARGTEKQTLSDKITPHPDA